MNFPLTLSFKILALASQINVQDAADTTVAYVKQKLLKLREEIEVFSDKEQTRLLYSVKADRVIDFSARYNFKSASGSALGSVKRQGMRSLWRAHYDVFDAADNPVMTIKEENVWVRVWDSFFGELPVIGMLSGYLFHPAYLVTNSQGQLVARLVKEPAFFEGKFKLDSGPALTEADEPLVLLSLLTMTLLERSRG